MGRPPPNSEENANALHRPWTQSGRETDEGFASAERTPRPPALRSGTFSQQGEKEVIKFAPASPTGHLHVHANATRNYRRRPSAPVHPSRRYVSP
jgi:hypothetical protein